MSETPSERPFSCKLCGADPTHLLRSKPTLFCSNCKPSDAVAFTRVAGLGHDPNHPLGMMFVGWGHGGRHARAAVEVVWRRPRSPNADR